MKHKGPWITWLVIAFAGLGLPAIIGGLIATVPNSITESADAGRFVSASTSAGGFLSPTVTTVQTSTATVQVRYTFGALHGAPVAAVSRLKGDLELCTTGHDSTCAELLRPWPGALHAVPYPRGWLTPLAAAFGPSGIAWWLTWGVLATMFAAIVCGMAATGANDDKGKDGPVAPHPVTHE